MVKKSLNFNAGIGALGNKMHINITQIGASLSPPPCGHRWCEGISLLCDVRMTQKILNCLEVNPFIQKSRSKGVTGYVWMDSFANQSLSCDLFDKAIQSLWCKSSLFIRSMLAQGIEHWIIRVNPILRSL